MNTQASMTSISGNFINNPAIFNDEEFLTVVGGDKTLQYELTQQFVETYGNAADEISQHLAAGDITSANRLLHTIKGLSGTFKATGLSQASLELEHELHEGRQASAGVFSHFGAQLQLTIAAMSDWLADHAPAPAEIVDNGLEDVVFQHLLALLGQNNMGAFEVYGDVHGALNTRMTAADMAELDSAMNKLNFQKAREILSVWYQNYNKSH